jgi:hypothetical protein
VEELHVLEVVQVLEPEELLDLGHPFVGERHGVRLLVDQEIAGGVLVVALLDLLAALEPRDDAVDGTQRSFSP